MHQFNDALAAKNRAGKKDSITELVTVEEGILRWFFMDTDILLLLYYDIHNQQQPIGDMPCGAQHMSVASWKKAIDKFIEETCDIIMGHYRCHIIKNGEIYPGCLQPHGYIDYAFPLILDDPMPTEPWLQRWQQTPSQQLFTNNTRSQHPLPSQHQPNHYP